MVLFAAPLLFSPIENQRKAGYNELAMIVDCAKRKTDALMPNMPHSRIYGSPLTDANFLGPGYSTENRWREWIKLETCRRLDWMIYIFDTLSIVEAGNAPLIKPSTLAGFPLPVPDTVWQAPSADAWSLALMSYCPTTLDTAMRDHFQTNQSGFSTSGLESTSHLNSLLLRNDFGMFGRLVMVVTLLRGLVALGRGDPEAADMLQHWGVNLASVANGKMMVAMVKAYGQALQKVSINQLAPGEYGSMLMKDNSVT
jgi:hypothetical protein